MNEVRYDAALKEAAENQYPQRGDTGDEDTLEDVTYRLPHDMIEILKYEAVKYGMPDASVALRRVLHRLNYHT